MISLDLNGRALLPADLPVAWRRHLPLALLVVLLGLANALLPLPVAVLLSLGSLLALLVLIYPFVGLMALSVAVPFGSFLEVPVGGMSISAIEPLVAILGLSWLAALLSRRERSLLLPWPLWPILLFLVLIAFEMTLARSTALGLKELLRWAELLTVAVVGTSILKQDRHLISLLVVILGSGTLEALLGWYQFLLRVGPPGFAWGSFVRAYGTFSQPNPFAGYLALVWPIALAIFGFWLLGLRQPPSQTRIPAALAVLALLSLLVIGAAVLMSFSRGAWLGLAASVAIVAGLYRRRLFLIVALVVGLLAAVVLLGQFQLLPTTIGARIEDALAYFRLFDPRTVQRTPENWAIVERMVHWQAAWGMFETAPIFGVGPGHYDLAYSSFAPKDWPDSLGHAHNYYLNVLAEMGALGLASYLLALMGWFAGGLLVLRRLGTSVLACGPSLPRALAAGVIGALVAAAVHNGFDNLYVHGMNVHVGLLLGLLLAVGRRHCFQSSAEAL